MKLLELIIENQALVNLVFSGVVAISTVVYAVLTWTLVAETRRMRRMQTEPSLTVFLAPHPDSINVVLMEVRNLGPAPAHSIQWEIKADKAELEARGVAIHKMSSLNNLHYLPPGRNLKFKFGMGPRLLNPTPLAPFEMMARYKSATGESFAQTFVIDVSELLGLHLGGSTSGRKMAKALEQIERSLANFERGWARLKVLTTDERTYKRRIYRKVFIERGGEKTKLVAQAIGDKLRAIAGRGGK